MTVTSFGPAEYGDTGSFPGEFSPGRLLLSRLPDELRATLARCAVVREFDRALYDEHLRTSRTVKLDTLVQHGWVEESMWHQGPRTRYWLASYLQHDAWEAWWPEAERGAQPDTDPPDGLKELSAGIAEYCVTETDWPIERLRQLAIAAPQAAGEYFDEVFSAHYASFDLAYCHDAIDALLDPDRKRFLSPELRDHLMERQRQVTARSMRSTEFFQTEGARYLPRPKVQAEFERLLSPDGDRWLLQLHGDAGMGKSTLLHWLIARVCLAEGTDFTPCARINCEALDPALVLDHPWLLLIEAAEQLNPQLPDGPFLELLNAFVDDRDRLRRIRISGDAADGDEQADSRVEEAVSRFQDGASLIRTPVVIVLDGLDQISFRSREASGSLRELIGFLRRGHAAAPNLRIVLAGRDDLSDERLVPWLDEAGPGVRNYPVPCFTDEEVAAYLRGREIPRSSDRAPVIRRQTKGRPMEVGLYADLLSKRPDLSEDDIQRNREPLVVFLIERIIDHIQDPVARDVLKYSVAADTGLDFTFFCEVVLRSLRSSARSHRGHKRLIPEDDNEAGLRELWRRILHEATSTGVWIYPEIRDGREVVVMHEESRSALRDWLLDNDPVFGQIHAGAIAYYEKAAQSALDNPDDPVKWVDEVWQVLYHLIQVQNSVAALERWRAARKQARERGRVDWVRDLAKSLAEAQDPNGAPLLRGALAPLRHEACVELALLAAQGAGRLPGDRDAKLALWHEDAERWLATAEMVLPGRKQPTEYEIIIRALIEVEKPDGNAEARVRATARLPEVTGTSTSNPARGDAWLVLARAEARQFGKTAFPEAPEAAETAYQAAFEEHTDARHQAYIALDAARWLLGLDRPDLALDWCDRLPQEGQRTVDAVEVRARALLALGRPGTVLAVAEHGPSSGPRAARFRRLAARAQFALRRPLMALRELEEAGRLAEDDDDCIPLVDDDPAVGGPEYWLRLASAYGDLLEVQSAQDCLTLLQRQDLPQADQPYQAQVNAAQALLHLRVTGDLSQAATYAPQFPPKGRADDDRTWTALMLARAELKDQQDKPEEVLKALRDVRVALTDARSRAKGRIGVALAGLAAHSLPAAQRVEFLEWLADDLALTAPKARLAFLVGLVRCEETSPDKKLDGRLRRLLAVADKPSRQAADLNERLDQGWQNLVLAEFFRVIGDRAQYVKHRKLALELLGDHDPYVHWEWLITRPSADTDRLVLPPDPAKLAAHYQHPRHELLRTAFYAAWADRYDPTRQRGDVADALRAAALTDDSQITTIWKARCREVLIGYTQDPVERQQLRESVTEIRILLDNRPPVESAPAAKASDHARVTLSGGENERDMVVRALRPDGSEDVRPLHLQDVEANEDYPLLLWAADAGNRLGSALSEVLHASQGPMDVKLTFRRPGLALDPWELSRVDTVPLATHHKVRYVYRTAAAALTVRHQRQYLRRVVRELGAPGGLETTLRGGRALPDRTTADAWLQGFLRDHRLPADLSWTSPETWKTLRSALRANGRYRGRRPLRVLIIQPVVGGNLDSLRGLSDRLEGLVSAYRESFTAGPGLDLRVIYGDRVSSLSPDRRGDPSAAAKHDGRPWADVLHVCTVMQATAQLPVLGLDAEGKPPLTAPELDHLIRNITGPVPPLVVLDIQAPPAQTEARRQLVLRNRFAQQLLALGSVNTVIASGLADRHLADEQWRLLTAGFASGDTAARICQTMQRTRSAYIGSPDSAEREAYAVAFTATALFSNLSADTLIEPGLLRWPLLHDGNHAAAS